MLKFLNFRILIIAVRAIFLGVNPHFFVTQAISLSLHIVEPPLGEQDLNGFSSPISDLFFENVDPFLQELQAYNFNAEHPVIWLDRDMADYVTNIVPFLQELQFYNFGS
jgi:hypothetical protein